MQPTFKKKKKKQQQLAQATASATTPAKRERDNKQQQGPNNNNNNILKKNTMGGSTDIQDVGVFRLLLGDNSNVTPMQFFSDYFEKQPLLIRDTTAKKNSSNGNQQQQQQHRFTPFVNWSTDRMRQLVATNQMHYSSDLNIVKYDFDQRQRIPFKSQGVVTLEDFDFATRSESSDWSVRFLRPYEHTPSISNFIYGMEDVFACSSGCNSYWTAAGSQGFAPHYDDVDVFLLQLEGSKHWIVRDPPDDIAMLTRHSSDDWAHDDPMLEDCKLLHDMTLNAGDMLYMPRGFLHYGDTLKNPPGVHSLHVTFSAYQFHTWADLLHCAFRHKIECLAASDVAFRRAIPRNWVTNFGATATMTNLLGLQPGDDEKKKSKKHRSEGRKQNDVAEENDDADEEGTSSTARTFTRTFQKLTKQICAEFLPPSSASTPTTSSTANSSASATALNDISDIFAIDVLSRRQPPVGALCERLLTESKEWIGVDERVAAHVAHSSVLSAWEKKRRTLEDKTAFAKNNLGFLDDLAMRLIVARSSGQTPPTAQQQQQDGGDDNGEANSSSSSSSCHYDQEELLAKNIRMTSKLAARLRVLHGQECRVYHCAGNDTVVALDTNIVSRTFLRFDLAFAPAIAHIIHSYPMAVSVGSLPMPEYDEENDEDDAKDALENRALLCEALAETKAFVIED